MKKIRILSSVFVLSFLFLFGRVTAWNYTGFSTPLKTLSGVTNQGTMPKRYTNDQIIEIKQIVDNRNIKIKIGGDASGYADYRETKWSSGSFSSYTTVKAGNDDNMNPYNVILQFPGTKTLFIKTSGWHIGVTGIYGTWWLEENDYNQYIGK